MKDIDNREFNEENVDNKSSEKNLNEDYVEALENKRGLDRQLAESKFLGRQWLNIFKTQTVSTVIGGLIFLAALFLAPYYLRIYFAKQFGSGYGFYGIIVGFAAVILVGVIFSTVYRNVLIKVAKSDKKAIQTTGVVVASSFLASHIVGTGDDFYGSKKVLATIYKVKIKVQNKTTIGYSKNYYFCAGEEVDVLFNPKKFWRCYILPQKENEEKNR